MKHDSHAFEAALGAAVGEEPSLLAELHGVFASSAAGHLERLERATSATDWREAAQRLTGLAASFGAAGLAKAARRAERAAPGDRAVLAELRSAIAAIG
jgi:histidine phosphotransfer protein HptB